MTKDVDRSTSRSQTHSNYNSRPQTRSGDESSTCSSHDQTFATKAKSLWEKCRKGLKKNLTNDISTNSIEQKSTDLPSILKSHEQKEYLDIAMLNDLERLPKFDPTVKNFDNLFIY